MAAAVGRSLSAALARLNPVPPPAEYSVARIPALLHALREAASAKLRPKDLRKSSYLFESNRRGDMLFAW